MYLISQTAQLIYGGAKHKQQIVFYLYFYVPWLYVNKRCSLRYLATGHSGLLVCDYRNFLVKNFSIPKETWHHFVVYLKGRFKSQKVLAKYRNSHLMHIRQKFFGLLGVPLATSVESKGILSDTLDVDKHLRVIMHCPLMKCTNFH